MSEIDNSSGGGIAARLAKLKLKAEQKDNTNSHPSPRATPPTRLINECPFSPFGPKSSTPRRGSQDDDEEDDLTKLRPTVILTTAFPAKRERPPPPPVPGQGGRAVPPPPPSQVSAAAGRNRSPPPPPSQPPAAARRNTSPPPPPSQPPAAVRRTVTAPPPMNAPPSISNVVPPKLPARKTSNGSLNSIGSVNSVRSLPPAWNGNEALPVQYPEKKTNGVTNRNGVANGSTTSIRPQPPRLPPRRPTTSLDTGAASHSNPTRMEEEEVPPPMPPRPKAQASEPTTPRRRLPPPPSATIPPPPPPPLASVRPTRPVNVTPSSPPPVPVTSRPKPPPLPPSTRPQVPLDHPTSRRTPPLSPSYEDPICLRCRDFTLADTIAAAPHLSHKSVPSIQHLATALSAPFPNSTLDIARAIFTWLHHNVAYDTKSFFGNSVKRTTPEDTMRSGLAVCQGYAELFVELAVLGGGIDRAHVKLISGGSKGYGHKELKPGDPIPEYRSGHAWNAVYVPELGRWHLIDPCWGAGHVTGPPNSGFHKKFSPECFTSSVEEFGRRHFPQNPEDQFVANPLSWEEFITLEMREGKRPLFCGGFKEEGFSEETLSPRLNRLDDEFIAQYDGKVTFLFTKTCQHVKVDLSKERLYIITVEGVDEQWLVNPPSRDAVPGTWEAVTWRVMIDFWRDPKLREGRIEGRKIRLMNFRDIDGRDGTGFNAEEWARKKGRVGYVLNQMVGWNVEE